jgi:hypothetical protein
MPEKLIMTPVVNIKASVKLIMTPNVVNMTPVKLIMRPVVNIKASVKFRMPPNIGIMMGKMFMMLL